MYDVTLLANPQPIFFVVARKQCAAPSTWIRTQPSRQCAMCGPKKEAVYDRNLKQTTL